MRSIEGHATTSTKVPLVNAPLSLLAIARVLPKRGVLSTACYFVTIYPAYCYIRASIS
ncbi:MAG: hypothetical protein KAR25_05385 [Methanosarcinales archaeon]|nr:hypothetical protein [Methanosarcinales archaeon]